MTAVDERELARAREQAAKDMDFWADWMPMAAELILSSQVGSKSMLIRKLIIPNGLAEQLMEELEDLGAVSAVMRKPQPGIAERDVLMGPDELSGLLAEIAVQSGQGQPVPVELDDMGDEPDQDGQDGQDAPPVDLVKRREFEVVAQDDEDDLDDDELDDQDDDEPGAELAIPATAELLDHPDGDLVPAPPTQAPVRVRARQLVARSGVYLADQPHLARGTAVVKQTPRATGRIIASSPRGAVRLLTSYRDYLRDSQTLDFMAQHAEMKDEEAYNKMATTRRNKELGRRHVRHASFIALLVVIGLAKFQPFAFAWIVAILAFLALAWIMPRKHVEETLYGLGAAMVGAWLSWWLAHRLAEIIGAWLSPPPWLLGVLGGVLVLICGLAGRDNPLVDLPPMAVPHRAPPLDARTVIAALCALGNAKMKEPDQVRVLMDPHRAGPGVQLDLELPPGVTAQWVMEQREKFAAALRRELGTVWPSVGTRHPGHLVVFISDEVMADAAQEPWPLLNAGPVDIFDALPMFTDQLGRWVKVSIAYASMIIGAVPRTGKTFILRQFLLVAGLDPRTKVIALDGKGTGDLSPVALYAHTYVRGARPDNPANIQKVLDLCRWLLSELGRRADIIDSLPEDVCPESKVTSELINARPDLGLGPIIVGIDETQSFFSYGFASNKKHKEIRTEIRDSIVELAKLGPALGIWIILATQQVDDSTIPVGVQANAVIRFCLKMEDWLPNDKVLGTGAYRRGIDATMFDFADKGIGFLVSEGVRHRICRSVMGLDLVKARVIAHRARNLRIAAGTLCGDALGQDEVLDAEVVIDIRSDCEAVMRQRQVGKAQHTELVDWLREFRPEQYGSINVEELSARLRAEEVPVRNIRSGESVRKGVRLSDLAKPAIEDDDE